MVNKAPINADPILYRFCNDYDKCDMKVGDIINIPHNLTCTNYNWHQEKYNNVYIISPLEMVKLGLEIFLRYVIMAMKCK